MKKILQIIKDEIERAEGTLKNIDEYPECFQLNAKLFYKGRKQQAEEILTLVLNELKNHEKRTI